MASLHEEPNSVEEDIKLLKVEIGLLKHDLNNMKVMTQYMYEELEALSKLLKS